MRPPVSVSRANPVCQICESMFSRRFHSAKSIYMQSQVHFRAQQPYKALPPRRLQDKRLLVAASPLITRNVHDEHAPRTSQTTQNPDTEHVSGATQPSSRAANQELSSITNMITFLDNSKLKVLNHRRVPSEADVGAALQACRVVADYIMDESVQPQITHMINEIDSTASHLLSLDTVKHLPKTAGKPNAPPNTAAERLSAQFRRLIDRISDTAYAIVAHPPVFITPSLLKLYVEIQARLGKPETLPHVFQLYASKPAPREGSGPTITYVQQRPGKLANAIEPDVIERALDIAIEARNLDAAVGVVEAGYAAPAFVRAKLVRQAALPACAAATAPIAAWALARNFSALQEAMDSVAATNAAFAGILTYVGVTASIGLLALTTANDQMRRVTWAVGVPLRRRWLREDERAALDRVACSWGFRERLRQGEEDGPEWNALRDYIAGKGMVLDKSDLMPGME